jgi:hypothetical protein
MPVVTLISKQKLFVGKEAEEFNDGRLIPPSHLTFIPVTKRFVTDAFYKKINTKVIRYNPHNLTNGDIDYIWDEDLTTVVLRSDLTEEFIEFLLKNS